MRFSDSMLQHQYRVLIGPRKAPSRSSSPVQPTLRAVFVWCQPYFDGGGEADTENVFQILGHARSIALTPQRQDFKPVMDLPFTERLLVRRQAGLFGEFAHRCLQRFLFGFQASGN